MRANGEIKYVSENHQDRATLVSMQNTNDHPEDIFIDRYMPGASMAEREEARANVRRLVAVLVRIDERLCREVGGDIDSPGGP
jgi:hypothetical protein